MTDKQSKPDHKDWHKKPPSKVRSIQDALSDAERQRKELPHVVQVFARDWDKVILADAYLDLAERHQRLRAILQAVLTRLAHKPECMRVRPAEEWVEYGSSMEFSHCQCGIKQIRAALEDE